jgi:hypothetical protein
LSRRNSKNEDGRAQRKAKLGKSAVTIKAMFFTAEYAEGRGGRLKAGRRRGFYKSDVVYHRGH